MWKISFLFEFGYIIFRGWGKSPLPLDIFTSNIPYIQNVYIALLSCAIADMQCINLKGNMLNKKQWMNVGRVFHSIYLKIVSEYDQEIPQSQTADNPVAPRGRDAQSS